jgi:hypothetical protein
MNLVVDETVEEKKDGSKNNIGMVVSNVWDEDVYICSYLQGVSLVHTVSTIILLLLLLFSRLYNVSTSSCTQFAIM